MPQRDTSGIGERIPRELIDADFTVAFSLLEMVESDPLQDNGPLLEKAERMLDDIRARLLRMTVSQREAFEPRCAELGSAIERARKQEPEAGAGR